MILQVTNTADEQKAEKLDSQKNNDLIEILGDDDLINQAYPGNKFKIIFSEDFMKKSKKFYDALPRLSREIVQNFIDANPYDPGTLNGVEIKHSTDEGQNTIRIRGNREFSNPTALYKLDSGKVDAENTAGGNGIGLKQTVLILFRDYGIENFTIKGTNRSVDYRLLSAQEINNKLEQIGSKNRIKKGRLVGELHQDEPRDFTEYQIVTHNTQVFEALKNMSKYGVHDNNPELQNMDYIFPGLGGFKLLNNSNETGALYLNGQIFRCKTDRNQSENKNEDETIIDKDYRGGPSGVTLYINTSYNMSIDRQPLGSSSIKKFMNEFIQAMSREDVYDVFIKCAPTWKNMTKSGPEYGLYEYHRRSDEIPVIEHFVYQLVHVISKSEYAMENFNEIFGNSIGSRESFVACDINNSKDIEKIKKKGYTLVPAYFKNLGIQGASAFIEKNKAEFDTGEINKAYEEQAMSTGVPVGYTEFTKNSLKNPKIFYSYLVHRIGKTRMSYSDELKKLSITFPNDAGETINKKKLYSNQSAEIIKNIRGLFVVGNKKQFFDNFTMYRKSYKVDFRYEDEELFTKISLVNAMYDNITIEIDCDEFSSEKIKDRTQKASKKESKKVGIVGHIDHFSKSLKRITLLMAMLFAILGAAYVVENFKELRNFPFSDNIIYNHNDIENFIRKYNQAKIPSGEQGDIEQPDFGNHQNHSNYTPDKIENFKKIPQLSNNEFKKLQLLKTYVQVILNIQIDNNLFLFEGEGAKGVNIGKKAIGLHSAMMHVSFFEALETFVHEVAHNNQLNHSTYFIHANSALHMAITDRYNDILSDIGNGQRDLTKEELFIINAEKYREDLK